MTLRERIEADLPFLADFRHDLHAHPELMFEEHRTSQKVQGELAALGIEFKTGLARGTGVLGWLPPTRPGGRIVALRADMDALPIREETGLPYASQVPGKMHACGHDGHTTVLMGAVRALAAEPDRGNGILFLFQPAEEGGAGADLMCRDGALDGSLLGGPADVVYGLHGWPQRPWGRFSSRPGAVMASTDQFYVTLRGRGGHAAAPELSQDVIVCLGHVLAALQSIVSRNVPSTESGVLTVANVRAGVGATNIIPQSAEFDGTIRTLNEDVRALILRRLREVVEGVCAAHQVTAEITLEAGCPVTVNDSWATERWLEIATRFFGQDRIGIEPHPKMGAEDFSYYGPHAPACFYFIGLCHDDNASPAGLHTPRFDFNDDVVADCVEMTCRLALEPVHKP